MSDTIHYYFNDPSTPDLVMDVGLPPSSHLPFNVLGYQGAGQPVGSVEAQAANCYVTLVSSINYVSQKSGGHPAKWAAVKSLTVVPRAGMKLNAYYDRYSLRFFYAPDQFNVKKTVYTCESADVVSHELGHAILDAIRPDLWNTPYMEVFAFHEGFSDCNAFLHICLHNNVLDKAFQDTNFDLRKSNVMSRIGEEFSHALTGAFAGLRDLSVKFSYVLPETLSKNGPPDQLTKEPHSFSRVWSSAFYDMLVSIYELKATSMDKHAALHTAADICTNYLLRAIKVAPATPRFYEAVAKAMLAVDAMDGSPYKEIMQRVFTESGILQTFAALSHDDVNVQIEDNDEVLRVDSVTVVRKKSTTVERLSDNISMATEDNPLLGLEIELPAESFYQFDGSEITAMATTDRSEVLSAAYDCLDYLNDKALVGPYEDTPFEAIDGKLVRSNISCDCFMDNSKIPGAPEYGKPWKSANNSGCCYGGCHGENPPPITIPKLGCYITDRSCNSRKIRTCSAVRIKVC